MSAFSHYCIALYYSGYYGSYSLKTDPLPWVDLNQHLRRGSLDPAGAQGRILQRMS